MQEIPGAGRAEKWKELIYRPIEANFYLLKDSEITPEALQNIQVDIERSVFKERRFLGSSLEREAREYNPVLRKQELKDVLVAFAQHNRVIEYCQGLSCYAAFLLQFYSPEESFSILARTIQVNGIERLFDKNLSLISKVLSVHARVLNLTLPESVRKSIQQISNNSHDYAAGWYLTLFSRLPPPIYAEILDHFFIHGFPVLFHAASAVVEIGHHAYITNKHIEPDQKTQILFKLAECPVPEGIFKATIKRNMQMVSISTIQHMLQEEQ
ncbi:hypothetical protein NEHOM01_2085 [Nematocida homosporus]|uniref:uncharacterized protein n=1 Tax=Nematocida homosporus TaxID=1912981 RepID=UPI00221FC0AA|nr:uncharacterized protein NEHOM01_2085 [Nematocida homosporus]KAI5187312.1 hypothetical protein NEHOM01_2085 [Nematocida homosporus]